MLLRKRPQRIKQQRFIYSERITRSLVSFVKDSVLFAAKGLLFLLLGGFLATRLLVNYSDSARFFAAEQHLPKFPAGTYVQRMFMDIHGFGNPSYLFTASETNLDLYGNLGNGGRLVLSPFVTLDKREPSYIDKLIGAGPDYFESLRIEPDPAITGTSATKLGPSLASKFIYDQNLKLVTVRWFIPETSSGEVYLPVFIEWEGSYLVYSLPDILSEYAGTHRKLSDYDTFKVNIGGKTRNIPVIGATQAETLYTFEDSDLYTSTIPVRRLFISGALWGSSPQDSEPHADPHRHVVGVYIMKGGHFVRDTGWNGGSFLVLEKDQQVFTEQDLKKVVHDHDGRYWSP